MKKKILAAILGVFTLLLAFVIYPSKPEAEISPEFDSASESGSKATRSIGSNEFNYEALDACKKQKILWKYIKDSTYKNLPDFEGLGLLEVGAMGLQQLSFKGNFESDFAPKGWKKHLHRRGSIAQIKWVSKSSRYTGIFQGADCALLRLSLTYKPSGDKAVAPGLALKVLRDNVPSANISALVSLDGQAKNYNFFTHPLSNIVPTGTSTGQKMVHSIFSRVSKYPEELLASDMAQVDSKGKQVKDVTSPRQLFFAPASDFDFSSEEHDVREDFAKIPVGTVLYEIYALSEQHKNFDYANYTPDMANQFLKDVEHIGDLVTTSEFISSKFGDDQIFFRHQIRPKKY